jgi:hypothetical protein
MKAKVLGILLGGLAFSPGFELSSQAEPPNTLANLLEAEADAQPVGRISATQAPATPAPAPAPPPPAAAAGPKRLAVPPAAEVKAALAKVHDIFSTEYAAAKTADAKAKLAKQLASHAAPDQPPAARTALLREAVRLAVEAGDVNVAMEAAGKMIDAFEVDRDAAMLEVYQSLLRTASPDAARDLGQSILKFVDEAMRGGRDETAEKAVPILLSVSRKARDPLLVKAASALKLRLAEKAALQGRLAPLQATLAESPNDSQANLELGQLLCFTAGNWKEGLPYLAKGADTALAAIAKVEATAGDSTNAKIALSLADGWFDWSLGQKGSFRAAAEERSLNYYLAASGQVGGLDGVRIGKQITELEKKTGFKGVVTPLDQFKVAETKDGQIALHVRGTLNGIKYTVQGKEWPHSFSLPPNTSSTSVIRFELPGKHRRLQGHVGIFTMPDTPETTQPRSPIVFTLTGDGKDLWRSPPLAKRDQIARFSADISGVISLELKTTATGSGWGAWAAWLDPELVE